MRAFAIDHYGEAGSLRDLPVPVPDPDEILVLVHVAGVNPIDWKVRDAVSRDKSRTFPFVLGQDFAGVIERRGRRTILLPDEAVEAIRAALRWKKEQRLKLGSRFRDAGLIFCGPYGRPINQTCATATTYRA